MKLIIVELLITIRVSAFESGIFGILVLHAKYQWKFLSNVLKMSKRWQNIYLLQYLIYHSFEVEMRNKWRLIMVDFFFVYFDTNMKRLDNNLNLFAFDVGSNN